MNTSKRQTTQGAGRLLVIGGSGKTGKRVVEKLKAQGENVRSVSRSTSPAFDWNQPETWESALSNIDAVYITYSPDLAVPGAPDAIQSFVDLAVSKGVDRLVLLSGRGEEEAQRSEEIVQGSGVDWTIVRSSWFMQNFSEGEFAGMVRGGAITLPAANIPEPFVDINDLADVVVAALTDRKHASQVYELTGPDLLTLSDVAAELARATGRDIQFVQIPQEAFVKGVAESGAPKEVAWLLNYLFETVLDGRNAHLSDGIQRALGREPAGFSDFADRIAARGVWNVETEEAVA